MRKNKLFRYISVGGLLASLTILFQSAPVFLPTIGMILSPFSTLPIAISAVINVFLGIMVLITSVFMLLFVSPQEAMILLFTTGLIGIVLGAFLYRKGVVVTIITTTLSLTFGMIILTYIAVIPTFNELADKIQLPFILLIYSVFSLVYIILWIIFFRKIVNHRIKALITYWH